MGSVMVKMIQSLHEGMKAEVSVDGSVTSEREVQNGLGQGCRGLPTLFNQLCMVDTNWHHMASARHILAKYSGDSF